MLNRKQRHFLGALSRIAKTVDGRVVMAYLREDIVNGPLIHADTHKTYYQLGQRDLAIQLIQASNESLDTVELINENEE